MCFVPYSKTVTLKDREKSKNERSLMLKLETGKFLGDNKFSYDAGGAIVSETEYHQRVFEGWHAHANHHITLVLRGGNREQRKGNKDFEAVPGSILYYRSGELHRNAGTLHPSKNINLEIRNSFLSQYQVKVPELCSSRIQSLADVKFSLLKIYKEIRTADAQMAVSVHSLILAILSSLFEEKESRITPPWIRDLREILHDRWDEVLSLHELSRLLGVHPVTISKKFPKFFSCTLGEYARKTKIEKAVRLIGQSQYSLTEIAHQCGFTDQSHFIRAFKAVTGFLPNEFRRL